MTEKFDPQALTFIPLGGSGEIGMNLNVYGYKGKWLIADCGITFDDERAPGTDVVMPDPAFLPKLKDDIVALVATHAHEDHIGAIPYLWPQLRCPIYATGFTASVLKRKLAMAGLGSEVPIRILPLSGTVDLDPFRVQLITLTHSIPEPNALVIRTDAGAILHTGDWKLDPEPIIGETTDEGALRQLADEGMLAMICDSTNVFVEETAGSEAEVRDNLTRIIAEQPGRVAVACFATNVARLHSIASAGHAAGRAVVLAGLSHQRIVQAAKENGYLHDLPPFLDTVEARKLPANKILYICTGSQGEPRSALARIAAGAHPDIALKPGDSVLFSSRVIPGNEKGIGALQNRLVAGGVKVIVDRKSDIHVSGHPARTDLLEMYEWVKPKAVIPVHGEMRHMVAQAELARSVGIPHAPVIQNGDVIQFPKGFPEIVARIKTGRLAVHGNRLTDIQSPVFRELRKAIADGHVTVSVCVDRDAELLSPIRISTLGLVDGDELEELAGDIEEMFLDAVDGLPDKQLGKDDVLVEVARKATRMVFSQETGRKPRVEVHLMRVGE